MLLENTLWYISSLEGEHNKNISLLRNLTGGVMKATEKEKLAPLNPAEF